MIDLRSDTVTKPSLEMRKAMFDAEVGDDVYGEDPTVVRLQERICELLRKEAAIFVASGVMGNQIGLKVNTRPGDDVIMERSSHVLNYEAGGGLLSGVQFNVVDGVRGIMTPEQVEAAIRPGHYWEPLPRLVWIENTVNKAGGTVYPLETIQGIADVARRHGLRMHLDGARLWNASAASGIPEWEYAAPFDTINVCLSKGLGAPVGSVLAGDAASIREALRVRKMIGGGMRQIGILAAAGLCALDVNRPRLHEDHAKARRLAEALSSIPAFRVDLSTVVTNIVMFDVVGGDAGPVLDALREEGVAMSAFGPSTIRATTHLDVSMDDIDAAIRALHQIAVVA